MLVIDFYKLFNTSRETFNRCLNKATIIVCDGTHILVADDEVIYYFGKNKTLPKAFKKFYTMVEPYMIGKRFYSNDLHNYSNRCVKINDEVTNHGGVYKWVGENNDNIL